MKYPNVLKAKNSGNLALLLLAFAAVFTHPASAVTLKIAPETPQPGDVLTVTLYPHAGENIVGAAMKAFDTEEVKFFRRPDGLVRGYLGLPFDRTGGNYVVKAQVETNNGVVEPAFTIKAKTRHFPTQRIVMRDKGTAAKMNQKSALRAEKLYVQSKMKESHGAPLWSGAWIVPSKGKPSSPYGRKRYVNGKWWGQHNGSDIKASTGVPVVATNSGRVVLSEHLPALRGNCVVVDHGCNVFSIYMHLSRRDVAVGQSVAKGQLLGLVGSTGFSTGPHLHWETRIGWEPVDPYQFVRRGLTF